MFDIKDQSDSLVRIPKLRVCEIFPLFNLLYPLKLQSQHELMICHKFCSIIGYQHNFVQVE